MPNDIPLTRYTAEACDAHDDHIGPPQSTAENERDARKWARELAARVIHCPHWWDSECRQDGACKRIKYIALIGVDGETIGKYYPKKYR